MYAPHINWAKTTRAHCLIRPTYGPCARARRPSQTRDSPRAGRRKSPPIRSRLPAPTGAHIIRDPSAATPRPRLRKRAGTAVVLPTSSLSSVRAAARRRRPRNAPCLLLPCAVDPWHRPRWLSRHLFPAVGGPFLDGCLSLRPRT